MSGKKDAAKPVVQKAPVATSEQGAAKASITPDVYNVVITKLTPREVRVCELAFKIQDQIHSGPLVTQATLAKPSLKDCKTIGSDGAVLATIEQQATFQIVASDKSIAAAGMVTFSVTVSVEFEPPEDFWAMFLLRNVKLYTHPALRDLVSSLVTRAGLLALPLASVAVTQRVG